MIFCIIALVAKGTSYIRGVESWRVKETDRLNAMACELQKLDAQVNTSNDSISITPPEGAVNRTYCGDLWFDWQGCDRTFELARIA